MVQISTNIFFRYLMQQAEVSAKSDQDSEENADNGKILFDFDSYHRYDVVCRHRSINCLTTSSILGC